MKGFFVTFEGGEGSGKTCTPRPLAEDVCAMPAGASRSPASRAVRRVPRRSGRCSSPASRPLVGRGRDACSTMPPATSILRQTIRPALAAGAMVICDRFMDSTRVYQGTAGGCANRLSSKRWSGTSSARRVPISRSFSMSTLSWGLRARRAGARPAKTGSRRRASPSTARLRDGFLDDRPGRSRRAAA